MFNKRRVHSLQFRVRFEVNLPPLGPARLLLVGAVPLFLGDVPLLVGDMPLLVGDVPLYVGCVPMLVGCVPLLVGDVPLLVGGVPMLVGDVPLLVGCVPMLVGDVPLLVGDVPLLVGCVPMLVGDVPLLVEDVPFTKSPEKKVSRHVELKYPQCFYSNIVTVYLQDYCIYIYIYIYILLLKIIRTVYYNIMYCIITVIILGKCMLLCRQLSILLYTSCVCISLMPTASHCSSSTAIQCCKCTLVNGVEWSA